MKKEPRRWAGLSWYQAMAWGVIGGISITLALPSILTITHWGMGDWDTMREAGQRISVGLDPYHRAAGPGVDGTWRYSPLLAWLFALIAPIGKLGWAIVTFAILLLLRDWRLIGIFLLAVPFWQDAESGLSFIEIPVVALLAYRGSYLGGLGLVALAVLLPRPMMIPLVGYLFWKEPRLRLPGLILAVVLTVGAVLTGWADEWVASLISVASATEGGQLRLTDLLGPAWLLMLPLAAWLTWRGHPGFAALAISPYWTPAYPMLLVLEIPWVRRLLREAAVDAGDQHHLPSGDRGVEGRCGGQRMRRLLEAAGGRADVGRVAADCEGGGRVVGADGSVVATRRG